MCRIRIKSEYIFFFFRHFRAGPEKNARTLLLFKMHEKETDYSSEECRIFPVEKGFPRAPHRYT